MSPNRHLRRPGGRPLGFVAGLVAVIAAVGLVSACAPASRGSSGGSGTGVVRRSAMASEVGPTGSTVLPTVPTTAPTTAPTTVPTTTRPLTYVTPTTRLGVGGCPVFPRDHVFTASIGSLPVKAGSDDTITAMGRSTALMAGFGSSIWENSRLGLPVNVVDGTAPRHDVLVSLLYAGTSETEDVPWPADPRFEGWPGRAWDKHLLVVDSSTCSSWELINVQPPGENPWATATGRWYADKVVKLDLSSNDIPANGTVTASGLSMLAGMVRYDEVATGRVDHVLTMAFPVVHEGAGIWPTRGTDGRSTDPAAPPMGTWLRLRSDVDLSALGPQARAVAQAMKDHGVVINDSGPNAAITGEPDVRWDDADLAGLRDLDVGQFEVVDPSEMKISDDSYRIR